MRDFGKGGWVGIAGRAVAAVMIAMLGLYRWALSPILHAIAGPGFGCRFSPSCSCYAAEALRRHGSIHGSVLAVRRLLKCHPFHSGEFDPVPDRPARPRCARVSS